MEATRQGIFRSAFAGYQARHGLSLEQHKAAQAIMECQSEQLGYEEGLPEWRLRGAAVPFLPESQLSPLPRRSKPGMAGKDQSPVVAMRYYHVVFTLPHELNWLWQYNRSWCTDRLFKASSETLHQLLDDDRYLGAEVGMLCALHTWGRTLSVHPHVHVLVTGCGLSGGTSRSAQQDFLLPVGVLKAKFRGKWLTWLNQAYEQGELTLPSEWTAQDWRNVLRRVASKSWNVRIQGAYRHGRGVAVYLSHYVRGGPIKDRRIVSANASQVSFRYHDYHDNRAKTLSLSTENFLSRVLWHVLPGARQKRDQLRQLLGAAAERTSPEATRPAPRCPTCGEMLFHCGGTRGKISYIKSAAVQQGVEADRAGPVPRLVPRTNDPPVAFFGPVRGHLT